jgi:hypothetical protein
MEVCSLSASYCPPTCKIDRLLFISSETSGIFVASPLAFLVFHDKYSTGGKVPTVSDLSRTPSSFEQSVPIYEL